jgi:hypothetical protein
LKGWLGGGKKIYRPVGALRHGVIVTTLDKRNKSLSEAVSSMDRLGENSVTIPDIGKLALLMVLGYVRSLHL